MSISIPVPATRRTSRARPLARALAAGRARPELCGLLLLAAVLNLWGLGQNGWANTYYAATVRSMAGSWHDFLYASFDASGVMTVDKPPLALWIQAGSVRAFGFGTWSMLVPQALMGIASVALVWDLVGRRFGRAAGFAGGLVLAVTPITVAMARHNNPDALLVLCSTAAVWCLVRALEDGSTRWVVWSGVAVGLGFETKMAAALLVVPALAAAYLYVAPTGRLRALRQLFAGGAAMAVVGLAWPVLLWLTPAGSRPWVSGTSDNSIWSLIFGYNGVGRVDGQAGGPGVGAAGGAGGPGGGAGAGGGLFGGDTGPLRLLNEALGGQAGWLLGFAVVALGVLAVSTRLRRSDARTGWLIAVGGSFLVTAVVFSRASGIFHPYYVSALAPFTAALVGAAVAVILAGGLVGRIGGPLAIVAGTVTELVVLHDHPDTLPWLAPVLAATVAVAAVMLATSTGGRVRAATVALVMGVLLLAPATWAAQTLGHPTQSTFPAGGPESTGTAFGGPGRPGGAGGPGVGGPRGRLGAPPAGFGAGGPAGGSAPPSFAPGGGGGGGMFGGNANLTQALAYAKAHGGGTVAVSSQQGASSAVISGAGDVAALGGFSGRESEVSVPWLADAVRDGRIRWVLTDGSSGTGRQDSRTGASTVLAAAARVGTAADLGATGTTGGTLYDLQGKADALIASAA